MAGSTISICNHSFVPRFLAADSVVVDCGGNRGEFAHEVISRFGCRVVCIEPVTLMFDTMERHPRLELHQFALGGSNQMVDIHVFGTWSTMLDPQAGMDPSTLQTVEVVTLGELLRRTGLSTIALLKLDIEGAEVDAFAAATDAELQSIQQITVEFHEFLFPAHREPIRRIMQRMMRAGFHVLPFSLDTTNVLFVNRSLGVSEAELLSMRTIERFGKGMLRKARRMVSSVSHASQRPQPGS